MKGTTVLRSRNMMYAIKMKKGNREFIVCLLPNCKTRIEAEIQPDFLYMKDVFKNVEIVEQEARR
jgi:hypothetical protein